MSTEIKTLKAEIKANEYGCMDCGRRFDGFRKECVCGCAEVVPTATCFVPPPPGHKVRDVHGWCHTYTVNGDGTVTLTRTWKGMDYMQPLTMSLVDARRHYALMLKQGFVKVS